MEPLDYPKLEVDEPGCCSVDGSLTHTQLPSGTYLCPACVRDYRERGWLDIDFEYTPAFFAENPHAWPLRLRRKVRGRAVLDPERVAAELRNRIGSGKSVGAALRRLQHEVQVGFFPLVAAVRAVMGLETREARRLVVQAVGGW
ncbi:MAG TPA: hypothetical protein VIL46_00205 [Gemmataceae bacterium]